MSTKTVNDQGAGADPVPFRAAIGAQAAAAVLDATTAAFTTALESKLVAISGTNTGDQTSITGNAGTATAALGLKTASTTVSISSATAPTTGQVLTATGGAAATWQTPSGTTYSPGTGLTLTGNVFSVTANTYAPARSIQTTSFTAAVGGRYTLNNTGGVASITDPTGTAAGQSYTVIMAAGTAQFNGAGTVFAASRFELIRSYNGSSWSTLSPLLSDTLTVGSNSWDGSILSGPQSFSSTTRPTSSGTGAPAATSLITRDDAMLLFGGRDLWPYCTISASANATAPRSTNGILSFDGTLSATAVSGNNLTVQVGNSLMSLDSYYDGASAVDSSKPWTIYLAASFLTVTNSELVFAVGATASSGVPASGTSAGFRISSAMLASVWRCTAGTVVESTPQSIAASTSNAYTPTKKNHIWLRNNGSGSLSLYIAQPSTLRASKPDFATATLIGTVTGVSTASAPGISLSLRATGNTSAVSGLFFYAASYTEI